MAASSDLRIVRHDARILILAASQTARIVATAFFLLLGIAISTALPELNAAPWLFLGAAVWQASGLLHRHRLDVDLGTKKLIYRDDWAWRPSVYQGPFNDPDNPRAAQLTPEIRVHRGDPGLVGSKLRSRRIHLCLHLAHRQPLHFPFGFPMGPAAAGEQARNLARDLGADPARLVDPADSDGPVEPAGDAPGPKSD